MKLRGVLGGALLVLSCARAFPDVDVKSLPGAERYPDATEVVLEDSTRIDFTPGPDGQPQALVTDVTRVKALKPTSLPSISVHHSQSFTEIVSIDARIVRADGVVVPIDMKAARDLPVFDGSVLVTDERAMVIPVPALPVGAVYEEKIVTRRFDIKPWVAWHVFGDTRPVATSMLTLSAPKGWTIRTAWLQSEPRVAVERDEGERHVWVFEAHDLTAFEKEDRAPALWSELSAMAVRLETWSNGGRADHAFETPEALSSWLAAQYAERAEVTPEIVATAKAVLVGVKDDPFDRAAALYEHACRTVRYCAIEIGYGGWIPHDAKDVQRSASGDCKDKATYLHALLKVAGINSAPTLIYAHDGTPRRFSLPSLGANFNHAILAVDLPQGVVYADPTQRAVPFGSLAASDQGATVLELRPQGAPLKTTPESPAERNVERQEIEVLVDTEGNASGTFKLSSSGESAQVLKRRLFHGTGTLDEWLEDRLWLHRVSVRASKPVAMREFADDVAMEADIDVRHVFFRSVGGEALLRPDDVFVRWLSTWEESRRSAVVSRTRTTRVLELTFVLPPGTVVRSMPETTHFESEMGRYSLQWSTTGNRLKVVRTLISPMRVTEAASIRLANALAESTLKAEHAPVVLQLPRSAR